MFRSSKKDVNKFGARDSIFTLIKKALYRRDEAKKCKREACLICFDEDVDPGFMFAVNKCGHRFCLDCVIKHIEVKLLDGQIPNCPWYRCKSQLSIDICGEFLTHKLSVMWKQKIKEGLTPLSERFYCPLPGCSYLMSKTELSAFSAFGFRTCYKCHGSFCFHCEAPWHGGLSCTDYKKSCRRADDEKLKSLANSKGWRQCPKCQHMIERISGCNSIRCRCGNIFCYTCGNNTNNHRDCNFIDRYTR